MKIRKINALSGPNYWSNNHHKLIVMVVDLEDLEDFPSDKLNGFYKRLKSLMPSLYSHRCSKGVEGGFFMRVKEGTWMGHIIEHVALEIQTLANMDTGFGRTREIGERGVYHVVFSYEEEEVGRYAAKAAVRVCSALIKAVDYNIENDLQIMREIREKTRLGPTTNSIIKEAERRGIPWIRLNRYSLCQLGYGTNQKRVIAGVTSETSSIGVELAGDKESTNYILRKAEVPVPRGQIVRTKSKLKEVCKDLAYPLVVKPINGNHGRGVTTNIYDFLTAEEAFKIAQKISDRVLVEQCIKGFDYRLLVINNKFVAGSKRTPAHIVGDGESSIKELVKLVNKDYRRGYGHENILTKIEIDKLTLHVLRQKNLTVDSIPQKGELIYLKETANLSTGGTAEDVTDIVHPTNVAMAERISKVIDLDICGIDIITTDISQPLKENGGKVIEVNAGPGFRMHLAPAKGLPRNVAAPVIDKLFPERGDTGWIPIIAVTGTNGKTTTTRLIAHMAKMSGYKVGYTTSDGVYIQNRLLMEGDCTGPASAEFVLKDPTVNLAVLECARGGILRAGLAFKKCDIGIVTNVSADHLGVAGINTIEQLVRLKSTVPETVKPDGFAILNADDDNVFKIRKNIRCKLALFSMDENNPRVKSLQKLGGITAVYDKDGYIVLYRGIWKMPILKANRIPLTMEGRAEFMIKNILPAVIAANVQGISIVDIKAALETFIPSPSQTPGRLNFFKFDNFDLLLDFAHNPEGFLAIKKYIDQLNHPHKVGIIAGVGDRRDEDIIKLGEIAASMFNEVIIRQERSLRGRSEGEIIKLLETGLKRINKGIKITKISLERKAAQHAIENAKKNSLIFISSDNINDTLKYIKTLKCKMGL